MKSLITIATYVNWPFLILLAAVFLVVIIWVIYLQYRSRHRKITYIEGTLIRKVKDNRNEERNVQNIAGTRAFGPFHRWRQEGETVRYYITFETDKGIKSFTVTKKTYDAIKYKQKGVIGMKGKKFTSFKRS